MASARVWRGWALAAACVVGCHENKNEPDPDWLLRCEVDEECGFREYCHCGLCSRVCDDDSRCQWLAPGAVCRNTPSRCDEVQTVCVGPNFSWGYWFPEYASSDGPYRSTAFPSSANNYRVTGRYRAPTVRTAAETNVRICWDGVDRDTRCDAIDPGTDVDNVTLLHFVDLTRAEVQRQLLRGTLRPDVYDVYATVEVRDGDTCADLSDFSFFDNPINLEHDYDEREDQYVLLFGRGPALPIDLVTVSFVRPVQRESNTEVFALTGCAADGTSLLDITADLSSRPPVDVPRSGNVVVDFSAVEWDALGGDIFESVVDSAWVAFYEGQTTAELERNILNLDRAATQRWDGGAPSGGQIHLWSTVSSDGDDRFPGFERSDGVWLFGLGCSTCSTPLPVALFVLNPI